MAGSELDGVILGRISVAVRQEDALVLNATPPSSISLFFFFTVVSVCRLSRVNVADCAVML